MLTRLSAIAPLLVVLLSIGTSARAWPLSGALALLSVGLFCAGPRLELDTGRQALTTTIGGALGYLLAMLLHEHQRGALTEGWTRIASSTAIAAAARLVLSAPKGGSLPGAALLFAGLVATGRARDPAYVGYVVSFLLATVWHLSAKPGASTTPSRLGFGGAILGLALALSAGATLAVRYVHGKSGGRTRYTAVDFRPRIGFSDRMEIGSLAGLLDSDERVLRVQGGRADYLRGVSLDIYEAGRWRKSEAAEKRAKADLSGDLRAPGRITIAHLSEGSRFFLPLNAADLVAAPASVVVDGMGSVASSSRRDLLRASFVDGPRGRAASSAPRRTDRMLPRRLRPALDALARRWTEGAQTPAEALDAIERRLRTEFSYSQTFERPRGKDPLIDFLFHNRQGHCEYFASALALLGRALGIPTRVVMGYRVSERSPFGYYLVRERNAHAWVEAWLPGTGWVTRDATPGEALPQNAEHEAGLAASSADAVGVFYDEVTGWLEQLTLVETSLAWLAGSLVLTLIVLRGARKKGQTRAVPPDERGLPFLRLLLRRAARTGQIHRAHEPLERLAQRSPDARTRELLTRYTALRYGGIGDASELARDVTLHAKSRDGSPRAPN